MEDVDRPRVADDAQPLRVGNARAVTSTLHLSRGALLPVLAGAPLPPGESARIEGERWPADLLHDWFDRARGLALD